MCTGKLEMILLGLALRQAFHPVARAQLVPPCTSSLNHTVTWSIEIIIMDIIIIIILLN
jgi:hypothetical protein